VLERRVPRNSIKWYCDQLWSRFYGDRDLCSGYDSARVSDCLSNRSWAYEEHSGEDFRIWKKLGLKSLAGLSRLKDKAQGLFTSIRLFTRGKTEEALIKKKKLSKKMHTRVQKMVRMAITELQSKSGKLAAQAKEELELYKHMLEQIKIWLKTGFHPKDKLISLWDTTARAISKGKSGKSVEFGRRWIITRLMGGYVTGAPCQKIGADADTQIADEVIINFMDTFGEVPESVVYDRGADSKKNLKFLREVGVKNICIFPKGRRKMDVPPEVLDMARRERSLNEASIASLKSKNTTSPSQGLGPHRPATTRVFLPCWASISTICFGI